MSARARLMLALALACALAVHSRDAGDDERLVVAAVDSEEAAALCAQSDVKLTDFWARAKAMGVAAAVIRPQSLDQAIMRGDILKFSRAEIERWKAAGLVEPSTKIRPDTFWTKDARLLEQVVQALQSQGVSVTTAAFGGFHLVRVPEDAEGLTLRGYDPERVSAAQGLVPIFAGSRPILARAGLRWEREGVTGQAEPSSAAEFDLVLDAAAWQVGASHSSLLRSAYARPRRLLLLRLNPALGVEGNLGAARAALRELFGRGLPLSLPTRRPPRSGLEGWQAAAARAVAWLLGILAPLFAARTGLLVLRSARAVVLARFPVASPVAQIAAALAATAALAALGGLLVHALASALPDPLGPRWAFAALAGPLLVAALTLYTVDLEEWGKTLRRPATYAALLKLVGAGAVLTLLLAPRWSLMRLGIWPHVPAFDPTFPTAWWWPWRWREMLVGFPLLIQAMFLINWRLECPDCVSLPSSRANDPRGWFLLGLLAPVGIVAAVGQGSLPIPLALSQTVWTLVIGAAIGAVGVATRLRDPKGPDHK